MSIGIVALHHWGERLFHQFWQSHAKTKRHTGLEPGADSLSRLPKVYIRFVIICTYIIVHIFFQKEISPFWLMLSKSFHLANWLLDSKSLIPCRIRLPHWCSAAVTWRNWELVEVSTDTAMGLCAFVSLCGPISTVYMIYTTTTIPNYSSIFFQNFFMVNGLQLLHFFHVELSRDLDSQ